MKEHRECRTHNMGLCVSGHEVRTEKAFHLLPLFRAFTLLIQKPTNAKPHSLTAIFRMTLKEISYNQVQQDVLKYFNDIGVEVDTAILMSDNEFDDIYQLSKSAAIKGMEIFSDRGIETHEKANRHTDIEEFFVIGFYEDIDPKGQLLSFRDFIGEGFDIENDKLQLITYYPELKTQGSSIQDGFVYALLMPPHGLRVDTTGELGSHDRKYSESKALTKVLKDYLKNFLGLNSLHDTSHLIIYKWSDDWSNYFTSGKEWWGAFFWTIFDNNKKTVTVIGASTTD